MEQRLGLDCVAVDVEQRPCAKQEIAGKDRASAFGRPFECAHDVRAVEVQTLAQLHIGVIGASVRYPQAVEVLQVPIAHARGLVGLGDPVFGVGFQCFKQAGSSPP